jgi:hypothetical protein
MNFIKFSHMFCNLSSMSSTPRQKNLCQMSVNEVKEMVVDWSNVLAAHFYDERIVKLCNIWTNA